MNPILMNVLGALGALVLLSLAVRNAMQAWGIYDAGRRARDAHAQAWHPPVTAPGAFGAGAVQGVGPDARRSR